MCRDMGVGIVAYRPLARGLLAGTRERNGRVHTLRASADEADRPSDFDVLDAVKDAARQRGAAPAAVALGWLLNRPGITAPIIGATAGRHLDDTLTALALNLSTAEEAALEKPYLPRLSTDYT